MYKCQRVVENLLYLSQVWVISDYSVVLQWFQFFVFVEFMVYKNFYRFIVVVF